MEPIVRVLAAFGSTALFSALLGLGLSVASRKFRVEKDPRIESLEGALPGLNCGACGYAGCEAYAEAMASEEDGDITKCKPGGPDTLELLGNILGIEADAVASPKVARLRCRGGDDVATRAFRYEGYGDCEAAAIHYAGNKGCKYGCMGFGTCIKVCPVDAIKPTKTGLVWVDPVLCIGCEACVQVCPTGVMTMTDAENDWFVACASREKGKATKSVCSVGCIGCRICERKFPDAGFVVTDNLAVLEYNKSSGEGRPGAAEACPVNCIVNQKEIDESMG